jgi:hypothetical protein
VWLRSGAAVAALPSHPGMLVMHGGRRCTAPSHPNAPPRYHILEDWLLLSLRPQGPSSQDYVLVASALHPSIKLQQSAISAFAHYLTPFPPAAQCVGAVVSDRIGDEFLIAGGQTARGKLCPVQRVSVDAFKAQVEVVDAPVSDSHLQTLCRTCIVHAVAAGPEAGSGQQKALAVAVPKVDARSGSNQDSGGAWLLKWLGDGAAASCSPYCLPPNCKQAESLRMFQAGDCSSGQVGLVGQVALRNAVISSTPHNQADSSLCYWQLDCDSDFNPKDGVQQPQKLGANAPSGRGRGAVGPTAEERPRCLLPLTRTCLHQKLPQPPGCALSFAAA